MRYIFLGRAEPWHPSLHKAARDRIRWEWAEPARLTRIVQPDLPSSVEPSDGAWDRGLDADFANLQISTRSDALRHHRTPRHEYAWKVSPPRDERRKE